MPHVLVAGILHPSGQALLDAAPGVTTTHVQGITEDCYAHLIGEADALLLRTQPMTAPTVAKADRLRIVSRHGVGYDAVDMAALNARGIALAICGDINSTTVAEHAAMMILGATKRVIRGDRVTRSGDWGWRAALDPRDLAGQALLLVGYGRIGQQLGAMMQGFGLTIRAYDPFLAKKGWPDGPVPPFDDLHDALAWADIVSISVPKTGEPLIATAEFEAMRDGTVLINTARGGIVDEDALIAALDSGRIGAAGLDVFEAEPLPADHPLTRYDQVVLSPHVAGVTAESAERLAIGSAQNIVDFFAGRIDPALVVNRDHLDDLSKA